MSLDVSISELRAAASAAARSLGVRWKDVLATPATLEALTRCEQGLGISMPPELREFLQTTDGFMMGIIVDDEVNDPVDFGIKLLSCAEILGETCRARDAFNIRKDLIVIAEYGGMGDVCFAQLSGEIGQQCSIIDGFNETPKLWGNGDEPPIAASFNEWLVTMLTSVSSKHCLPMYWLPDSSIVQVRDHCRSRDDR